MKSQASCDLLKENSLNNKILSGINGRRILRAKLHEKIRKISIQEQNVPKVAERASKKDAKRHPLVFPS